MAEADQMPDADEARPAARWRRFVALSIDGAILGLPALGIGMRYFDAAAALGDWGLLIGLSVALLYFTVFDSWWAEGRSPGKRLLRIAVRGDDAALLTPARAALRLLILYVPFLIGKITSFDNNGSAVIQGLAQLATFGILASSAYLFLFSRSRRALHDLLTGAVVVVDAKTVPAAFTQPMWRGHWVVVACICAMTFATPFATPLLDAGSARRDQQWRAIRASVAALPAVRSAAVGWAGSTRVTFPNGTRHVEGLSVIAELRARPTDLGAVTRQIEDAVFADYADSVGEASVFITMRYGFNFGIAHANTDIHIVTSAAKWRAKTQRQNT